jgi:GNAT superfamily N-acetyltransferase
MPDVRLRELGLDDDDGIAAYVAIENACLVDAPWWHASSVFRQTMLMTHGDDGEVGRFFLVVPDDAADPAAPVGALAVHASDYDNLDQAFLQLFVHPEHRRRGFGRAAFELAYDEVRAMGRSKVTWFGWESEQTSGFAAALGFEPKSLVVSRRQHLAELEPGLADRLYADALPHAGGYELRRVPGRMPEDLLPEFVEATAAINDAPLDDLDMEDEVFTPERNRAFEEAQLASGNRLYRIVARHVASGQIAGVTSLAVDGDRPSAHQLDTSVVRSHRGHRLGVLLKADMVRWLAEAEPLLQTVDTFNADSNDHMVAVNELLGYRVMGRELHFQGTLGG